MNTVRPQIEIRRATIDDEQAIQSFIAETYGPAARFKGPARWRWQFVDNPYRPAGDSGPSVWLAVCAGRVVGQIAVQDGAAWLDGIRLDAGWIVDVMVHPAYRGLGLGHRIHERILQDRSTLVTLTMAPATRRIAERAGCVTLGSTQQFFRFRNISGDTVRRFLNDKAAYRPRLRSPVRVFNSTVLGPALAAGSMKSFSSVLRNPSRDRLQGYDIREVVRFPETMDVFWRHARSALPAVFERSARFLNWRFCDCPGLEYRRFLIYSGGEVRGYLVTRTGDPSELPLGVIADVFVLPGDSAALDALLALAQQVLGPHSEYLEAAASTPDYCAALGRAGFHALRTMRPTVVCTDPDLRSRIAARPEIWHFTKADHDWDQVHPVQAPAAAASQR